MASGRSSESAIRLAQVAAQSGVEELLGNREAKIITKLVAAYHARTLTPQDALIGVATISELRSIVTEADRAIERGADVTSRLGTPR